MFESLTSLLPELENGSYGAFTGSAADRDATHTGSVDKPFTMPHVNYSASVWQLEDAIYAFVDAHRGWVRMDYQAALKERGLEWGTDSMDAADVSVMDSLTVFTLLLAAVRAERFCDGALLDFPEKGTIQRWLRRLMEIDRQGDAE